MERAILAIAAAVYLFSGNAALATTGPGCFQVVNVASWDVLNMRSGPSASNPIVDHLPPGRHGIISQSGPCIPAHVALRSRWCPVTHYSGDRTTSGWVKRHFVAPSDCP
ncbi:MAG TPA: SH3 domain-containing protein [Rhizobiales bacterium]|nr:hypothetical protein BMS3Bbin10_02704 [bacterium BMS3Bbin10]HDO52278.1 SH3 domain-containing protein [Hyphomicrobiales bacterium]